MKNHLPSTYHYIVALLVIFAFTQCETESEIGEGQAESFIKYFGNSFNDVATDVVLTPQGGYAITGTTTNVLNGLAFDTEIFFILTDQFGNAVSPFRKFGTPFDDQGGIVELNPSGGYYLFATINDTAANVNPNTNLIFASLDENGALNWSRHFGGTADEQAASMRVLNDGSIILGASTESFGNGQQDAWLIKVDAAGNTIWSATHGGVGNDKINDVIVLDNGYIIAGTTNSFPVANVQANVFLIRTNSLGKATELKVIESVTAQHVVSILPYQNQIVLLGSEFGGQDIRSQTFLMYVNIDFTGSETIVFPAPEDDFLPGNFTQRQNGNLIIAGTRTDQSDQNIMLAEYTVSGEQVFRNLFGIPGIDQIGTNVALHPDGSILITGANGFENNLMATLIKTLPDGNF